MDALGDDFATCVAFVSVSFGNNGATQLPQFLLYLSQIRLLPAFLCFLDAECFALYHFGGFGAWSGFRLSDIKCSVQRLILGASCKGLKTGGLTKPSYGGT